MQRSPIELGAETVQACLDMGFAAAGIARAEPTRWSRELLGWIAAGKHGSMAWLEDHLAERMDPGRLVPGAASVIVVADRYADRVPQPPPPDDGVSRGRVARYAQGRDYHVVIKKRLHALADRLRVQLPGARFRSFVDIVPVLEREHAARAGLGWVGKNTLLISPRAGSYFTLGGIVTTANLEHPPERPVADGCGSCTRCIDACPTGAITPYSVDASRCISYLTIELRGEVPAPLRGPIGDWLFGCDVCQEVCPHNAPRSGDAPAARNPAYGPARPALPLLEVLGWGPEDRSRVLSGSSMKRATLAMLKRNAVIAAANAIARGNADAPALRERLAEIAADDREPPLARAAAVAALAAPPVGPVIP